MKRDSAPVRASGAPASARPPPHGLTVEQLAELYYYMRLTRTLETRIVALKRQGHMPGGVYRSLGQEADAVGSAYVLDRARGDVLCPLIRNLGSVMVCGVSPLEILRQNLATAESPTKGREFSFNFADLDRGFVGHISHLGDMVPVMAGVALSFRLRGEDRIALVYAGDGSTSTGAFHEGMSFAAAQRVPLVVIVEYNHYAYSTPPSSQFAVPNLADRALAYGIPGVAADGNDVLEVYGVTKAAVARARRGEGVSLIELKTYRRTGHAEHDSQRYVPAGEISRWEANDPLTRYRELVVETHGWLVPAALDAIDHRVDDEVDRAAEVCLREEAIGAHTALDGVYHDPPVAAALRPFGVSRGTGATP